MLKITKEKKILKKQKIQSLCVTTQQKKYKIKTCYPQKNNA